MKLHEFWNALCIDSGYRFFSGIPTEDFKVIHDSMNPEFLHFVPTLNEVLALGLVSGVKLAGTNGAVMMSAKAFDLLKPQFDGFNKTFNVPVLFIVENEYNPLDLYQSILEDNTSIITKLVDYIDTNNASAILVVKRGTLI